MNDDARWDLAACVERLRTFREARDWARFHNPKDLAAAIAIEAGELQELFLWKPVEDGAVQIDDDMRRHIEAELADVAIFALYLADKLDVDLARAILDKVEANEVRYDADRHRGVAEKART